MKRIFLGVLAAFVCTMAGAQNTIPNPGFEQWNTNPLYADPVGWGTINGLTFALGVQTVTKATGADVHSGTAAMKLESKTVAGQGVAPGIAATGTVNAQTQGVDGGVAFNKRPASMSGWYKYQPNGTDTGSIEANLFRWNAGQREQVGRAEFEMTSTVNSYTQFTVNFVYTSPNAPDTLVMILLTSSGANASPVGTKLFVDDLSFEYCSNFSLTPSSTPTTCNASDGTATITNVNGEAAFTYAWAGGGSGATISNKAAGSYNVTVTDANNCVATASVTVNSTNVPVAITPGATTTACGSSTGTATATPTSGTSPYGYLWGGGETTQTISGLGAGSYNVTVTDANGCSGTAAAAVTTPNGPSATNTITPVACFGDATGGINITTTGGTAPITYSWSNSTSAEDLTNVVAGTYTVTISDVNSCTFLVTANIGGPPAALAVTTTPSNVACFGESTGIIVMNPTGGTAGYTFSINGSPAANPATGLAAGSYTIVTTDANSCSVTTTATITQPTELVVSANVTNVICWSESNGSINVSTTGGVAPYIYSLGGNTTNNPIYGLDAGTYTVVVTDANNCSVSTTKTVTEPVILALTISSTDASTPTSGDGSATVTGLNGNGGPYMYMWNTTPPQNTATINNLSPGTYCVTVTDIYGCTTNGCENISSLIGINNVNNAPHRIYPNPAADVFTMEADQMKGSVLRVYAVDGSLKLEQKITSDVQKVSVTDLPQGVYTYKVLNITNVELFNGRIVISR